jgi:TonB-linked SusC/RagA family outer membrane protein
MTAMKNKVNISLKSFCLICCFLAYGGVIYAQTITGTVTDANSGSPLPGVNIAVKDTTIGTFTGSNGQYSLNVPSLKDTLLFSFIGYAKKTIPINGRKRIDVKLTSKVISSGQSLVVVGYGTQKKQNVTGAISSISSKQLKNQPVTNLQDALEGKVAGVNITQNSGQPGRPAQVHIRGFTSINNSQPLYVVDGVPLTANNINAIPPNDIASIQILKDASAEAIYGSRGANGVILIKTKHGTKNKHEISVNVRGGVGQAAKKLNVLNSLNYVKLNNEAYKNAGETTPFKKPPSAYTTSTNWQDALFRTAPTQNYNVAFSGGSNHMTYHAGGSYLNKQGIIIGSKYNRLSFMLNTTFDPTSNFEYGENLTIHKTKQYGVDVTSFNSNEIIATLEMDPTVPVKQENGNWSVPRFSDVTNPIARIHLGGMNSPHSKWGIVGNTYAQFKPVKGLSLKSNFSVDVSFADSSSFSPLFFAAPNYQNQTASFSHSKAEAYNWAWFNTVTYQANLNTHNFFKILGGISMEKYSFNYLMGFNQGQPGNAPYLRNLNAGISGVRVGGQPSQWGLLSYFARLNYNYNQTYFLTASFRRDGSSKFGPGDRYGNFPAFSAGWVLTNEPFLSGGNILSYLKLRGSWGITGNQSSLGYYDYASPIVNNFYLYGPSSSLAPSGEPGRLGNTHLHWEQVNQWNIGLDYRLVNNHLSGSFDYYSKTTKGMLLRIPILSESGFTQGSTRNAASMVNSGIEFTADYQQSLNKNLLLNIGIHFSTLHNKVLSLERKGEVIHSASYKNGPTEVTEAGHRLASFYGYVDEGIFQNEQQIKNHATQTGAAPGDIKFKDLNGDGVINDEDRTFLGSPIPKATYGFHLGGSYKDFDWNMSFSGVYGNKIFQTYKFAGDGLFISNYNMLAEVKNRWHGKGTSNSIPRLDAADPNDNARVSNFYLGDGSYLKLQNITIGYTLPKSLIPQASIKKIRVYISAENLVTFTKYKGYSPEIGREFGGLASNTLDIGIDPGNYPQPRILSLGIHFTF